MVQWQRNLSSKASVHMANTEEFTSNLPMQHLAAMAMYVLRLPHQTGVQRSQTRSY